MPLLSIALLGPFSAELDGRPLAGFRSDVVRALLIYLAAGETGAAHRREALTELLWPGMPPPSGRKNLRQTLYELRQAIPELPARSGDRVAPLVLADRQSIRLNPAAGWEVDVVTFEKLLRQGNSQALAAAADLYRGDFLSDFYLPGSAAFEEWAAARRAYYRDRVLDALSRLARDALDRDDYDRALAYARRQLDLFELHEPAHRQLMEALAGSGRRPEALNHYDRLRRLLLDEVGVEPSAATAALYEAIVAGQIEQQAPEVEATPVDARRPAAATGTLNNLPPQATAFVGREEELAEIGRLLVEDVDCRLLTLLGPGGSGKTRLALEAAGQIAALQDQAFPDGLWFVPLDALDDPDSVIPEVAKALDICLFAQDEPRRQVLEYFHNKRLLLVMDNYEHLLQESQLPFAAEILSVAPQVKLLVTSRTRLNVHGERLLSVAGLSLPPADAYLLEMGEAAASSAAFSAAFSAIRLFCQSARRVQPGFEITPDNFPAVVRVGRLVQGMPLGIELAAAWMELLSPQEIADELARNLDFLESEWRDLPERQRSLRAVFESSWKMLAAEEQAVVKALSIFRGGFSHEAARQVRGASLKQMMGLANKSWLNRLGDGRLQMHSLLRQYTRQKLAADEQAWQQANGAHADYYATWLTELKQQLRGPEQGAAFDAVSRSFEDVRAAWYWMAGQREWTGLTEMMLPALLHAAAGRVGLANDILAMIKAARQEIDKDEESLNPAALLAAAAAALTPGYYAPAVVLAWMGSPPLPIEAIKQSWGRLNAVPLDQVDALWPVLAAFLYGWQVDRDLGVERLRGLVSHYRQGADPWALAFSLAQLGRLLSQMWFPSSAAFLSPGERRIWGDSDPEGQARWEEARRLLVEARALWQEIGDRLQQADTLRLLGTHTLRQGLSAINAFHEAQHLYEQLGDPASVADVFSDLARANLRVGQFEQAFAAFREVRAVNERLGYRKFVGYVLSEESRAALRYGDLDQARELRARSLAIARELDNVHEIAWGLWELGDVNRVAGDLAGARHLYEQARPLLEQFDDEVGRCFYQKGLGDVSLAEGDGQAAREHFRQALAHAQAGEHDWSVVYCRCGLARAEMMVGNDNAAYEQLAEALRLARLTGFRDLVPMVLTGLAQWWAAAGEAHRALALGTFVVDFHATWHETRAWAAAVVDRAAEALHPETFDRAVERGRSLAVPTAVPTAVLLALDAGS